MTHGDFGKLKSLIPRLTWPKQDEPRKPTPQCWILGLQITRAAKHWYAHNRAAKPAR